MKKFIQELQRRNVIKSALAYLVVAWLVTQVMAIVIPAFKLHESLLRTSIIVLIVCFPFWIIFSWIYEITPDGIKKTVSVDPEHSIAGKTSNQLNYIIIAGLVITIGLLISNIVYSTSEVDNETDVATSISDKSIAVLAFADMSPQHDKEYFSDGISEEILNLLTKIPNLKVISRTSSFSYKHKNLDIKKIARELNVGHILEGSIRKSGNTFRITTQLIDATTGTHIWSETYDRQMEDIFKIQDEIATKVTKELKISLLGTEVTSTSVNTDAYTLFLQAGQLYSQVSTETDANAFKLTKESIAIDSTYAPAWSLLSSLYYRAGFSLLTLPMDEAMKEAKDAAEKSISIDPDFAKGYLALAMVQSASWNFKEASKLLDKASLLEPNNTGMLYAKSNFASITGKPKLAIELQLKTIELDPLKKAHFYNLGLYYWMNGQFTKAEESLNDYLLYYPNQGFGNGLMSEVQLSLGHPKKALDYIGKDTHVFWNLYRKSKVVYNLGDKHEANKLLKQLIADYGDSA